MHNRKRRKPIETAADGTTAGNLQQSLDVEDGADAENFEQPLDTATGNSQRLLATADDENTCQNVSNSSGDVGLPTFNGSLGLNACEGKKDDDVHGSSQPGDLPSVPKVFPGSVLSSTMSHLLLSSYMCFYLPQPMITWCA